MHEKLRQRFHRVGASVPCVLLPGEGVDYKKFATIACDQFSADPAYWDEVERFVGGVPSSMRMMLPEAWLKTPERGGDINAVMQRYLDKGVLRDVGEGLVYVCRETGGGVRRGLVIALDLEQYDFTPGANSRIRATEQTVVERLPVRVDIRRGAPLEMPHIMVLVSDREDLLMSALDAQKDAMPVLYDFDLMKGGGRITGYAVQDDAHLDSAVSALERLCADAKGGMVYAMGDGNHSFAAAKACWNEIKTGLSAAERERHPARYSLVELVNLYDPALQFEPIHRALLGVDPKTVQREAGFDASNPPPLQQLQPMLDAWFEKHPQAEQEYIHGEQECRDLCAAHDRLAIILPEFDKDSLFDVVLRDGVFVRKSFSMGHATDKRYYLECRKIR